MKNVLKDAVDIIVKNFTPDKIILLGPQTTETVEQDGDYDLCIIKSNLQHKRKIAQDIYQALAKLEISVDVIVETPENFAALKANPFLIYGVIAEKGKVLYEKQ